MEPSFSPVDGVRHASDSANVLLRQAELVLRAATRHAEHIGRTHNALLHDTVKKAHALADTMASSSFRDRTFEQMIDYWTDAGQRLVLTIDVLRERANNDLAHEAAGTPPVLIYDNETIVDGKTLKRPTNYVLLEILPPKGVEISGLEAALYDY